MIAATIPDGKLFKVTQGKVTPFATLDDVAYVWSLAVDAQGTGVYAATGGKEGKVLHVRAGSSEVVYKSDEPHLVSVALAPNGDVYAGSSGKGILYKIKGPGRAARSGPTAEFGADAQIQPGALAILPPALARLEDREGWDAEAFGEVR